MLSIEWILLYLALGSFVGFMAGLLGVGGGGILVPLLASIFAYQGLHTQNLMHLALGTSLACMIISSTASIYAHGLRGTVVWKMVYGLAPGIILGAFLITRVAANLNSIFIAAFFSLFMVVVAAQMFFNWKPNVNQNPAKFFHLFLIGAGIGAVSALAAVGGGFLAMTYLNYKNLEMKKTIGTSAALAFPIAITGTLGYMINGWSMTESDPYTIGFIDIPAFVIISVTSFIAAPYGAAWANRLPEMHLKKIFALVCLLLSVKMLVSVVGS